MRHGSINSPSLLTTTDVRNAISVSGALSYNSSTGVLSYVSPTVPTKTSQLTNDSGFLTGNQTITVSGDATGSGASTIALTLANTAVTPGSYGSATGVPIYTVDAKGRLTASSAIAIAFPVTSVAGRTGAVTIASADVTDAVSANTASVVVKRDANGNFAAGTITAALAGNASTATSATTAGTAGSAAKLTTARAISHSGDATGSATFDGSADVAIPLTLATVNTNTGTFNRFTVNGKGLITAAVNRTITGTSGQIVVSGGDFSADPVISLAPNVIVPGTEGITVPNGTTAQRPSTPMAGETRYNTDTASVEFYQGGTWVPVVTNTNSLRSYVYYAEQFDSPTSSNWSVNGLAPALADPTNDALIVRAFDDSAEEGVGFKLTIPTGVTNMTLRMRYRAATAPTLLTQAAVMRLHRRSIAANTAISAWAITTLNNLGFPANATYQSATQTLTLSSLGLTAGNFVQFELTRQGGATADTLTGDTYLLELIVDFT